MFSKIKQQVRDKFDQMVKNKTHIFTVNADKTKIWETYLNQFTDPVEQQSHNCNCCKSFLRQFGSIVTIENNEIISIWDLENVDAEYAPSIKALSEYIHTLPITNVFFNDFKKLGTDKNVDITTKELWQHFYVELPTTFIKRKDDIDTLKGSLRDVKNVFKRSLEELNLDAFETVLELIEQNSLYRGKEYEHNIKEFLSIKKKFDKLSEEKKDNFCWEQSLKLSVSIAKIRNTAIGTLLIDISEGKDLDASVSSFERVVAPANYKRPTSLVTPKMIEQAKKTLEELGYLESLDRRYAILTDVSVNDVLFTDKTSEITDVFADMSKENLVNPKSFSKIEEIPVQEFIEKVVPKAKSIEVLFENKHMNNMVSLLTASNKDAPSMFKWNNPFSWSYTGGITDSIKERVKAAGGNVSGVLRFSIQWNENGKSIVDFDVHAIEPNHNEIAFNTYKGHRTAMSGMLDVDMIRPADIGIENIVWDDQSKMKYGTYKMFIRNYCSSRNSGFTAQIEFDGQIFDFAHNKHVSGDMSIAEVTYSKDGFSIKSLMDSTQNIVSKEKWNLKTNQFYKVKNLMFSPNYWNGAVGNKHFIFNLENCVADETPRPFFNEFLKEELNKDRKVFEVLGSKVKVSENTNQLSGLGFSETQKNSVIVRVNGAFKRNLKIIF